jgi:hypothetical protein
VQRLLTRTVLLEMTGLNFHEILMAVGLFSTGLNGRSHLFFPTEQYRYRCNKGRSTTAFDIFQREH